MTMTYPRPNGTEGHETWNRMMQMCYIAAMTELAMMFTRNVAGQSINLTPQQGLGAAADLLGRNRIVIHIDRTAFGEFEELSLVETGSAKTLVRIRPATINDPRTNRKGLKKLAKGVFG